MTLPVFPTLAGRAWPLKRTAIWQTVKQPSISGQETRLQLWSYPRWRYELALEVLRTAVSFQEFQSLVGLYNLCGGAGQAFLYNDPYDNATAGQPFGVGDGATTAFQLVRTLGGFVEPVFAPTTVNVSSSDWQGINPLSSTGRTNLLTYSDPASGGWTNASGGTLSDVSVTAPDGSGTVSRFIEGASGSPLPWDVQSPAIAVSAGATYTRSIWAKPTGAGSERFLSAYFGTNWTAGGGGVVFDVNAGTVSVQGTGMTGDIYAGTGGWYRCVATGTIASGVTSAVDYYTLGTTAIDTGNHDGDDVSGLYLFGAQFEAGSVATPLIRTSGTAQTVVDYALGTNGTVNFTTAPAAGTSLLWSGLFDWLCRFDEDQLKLQQDFAGIWSGGVSFSTVKL